MRNRHLGFVLTLGLIAILVIVVIMLFVRHNTPPKPQTPLSAYTNSHTAQAALLIDGPVNAVSQHNQVQILVTNSMTTINVFRGYDGQVMKSQNFIMTPSAFNVFLRSLEGADFTSGNNNPQLSRASGYCPLGDRYIFSFSNAGKLIERYWATNCSGTPSTYEGNVSLTLQLFQNQVPDYGTIVSNLNL